MGALSSVDRQIGLSATRLAARGPSVGARWLKARPQVAGVQIGGDGATLDVRFRDGGELVILPPQLQPRHIAFPTILQARLDMPAPASSRALVLEPFANELSLGSSAGQAEATILARAGFAVTVLRNEAVSVEAMETLPSYSVVYMLTHSGTLPNGDAIIVTGEVSPARPQQSAYAALYSDHSLLQATVAGQSQPLLYNAITSTFVRNHLGSFPPSSFIFLNGCQVLGAPIFWQALQAKGVRAMVGWDNNADSNVDVPAGELVLSRMASGDTLAAAISAAAAAGLSTSTVEGQVAHLGLVGDGSETLGQALSGTVPTATPVPTAMSDTTPTPRATPTPISTSKPTLLVRSPTPTPTRTHPSRHGHCKPGHHRSHGRCVVTKHKRHPKHTHKPLTS